MRVPFPYPLHVGTDIIAYSRLLPLLKSSKSSYPKRLIDRVLHPREIATLHKKFPKWQIHQACDDKQQEQLAIWLAGRWAAKEAAKKAWGAHLISFRDLRIEQLAGGEVEIVCQSFDQESGSSEDKTEQAARLSISHDGGHAVATVLASSLHPTIVAALKARKVSIPRSDISRIDFETIEDQV